MWWNLRREEQLVLLILVGIFTVGLGVKLMGGIPVSPPPPPPELMTVKICGAVKKPGWYRIPEGSLVGSLIKKAGGPLPWADLSVVNPASPISSRVVYIPEGKLNLNLASVEDLTFLPGIGPELADRIVSYRDKIGGFKSVSQLKQVPGIGETRLQKIKDMLTID
ncbi:helix-hairpin-helix domain-containing protein [Candidatus Aerophobetes bacterium]|nr:helix-hairpin-helix domain-containing protein [Candidatus Aerophobetes bacterium]